MPGPFPGSHRALGSRRQQGDPKGRPYMLDGQVPTASRTHFLVKLALAAPASFFSDASDVQVVVASFSHFVMKLLSAAPASFLSEAWALHVASCAKAVAANVDSSAASNIFFIGFSSVVLGNPPPAELSGEAVVYRGLCKNPVIPVPTLARLRG